MRMRTMSAISMIVLLALALCGCSADNAVAPLTTDDANSANRADKVFSTPVLVYGYVYLLDGSPADNTLVRIDLDYGNGWVVTEYVPTTGSGYFSLDTYLWPNSQVRCACLGDVEVKAWTGRPYMFFRLDQQPGSHVDELPAIQ